jgi:hypothetical protein
VYCAECGTANTTGAETCEICGSPLGSSSGDLSCHVCGSPMSETDRFCRTCGQSQSGASAGRYEPGPSFVDDSALKVDPFELPPWLREMTSSAGSVPDGRINAPSSAVAQSDTLPPWLDAAPPANGSGNAAANQAAVGWPKPAARPNDESMAEFSLISEDDLPEWLRALGDQEFEVDPAPIAPTNGAAPSAQPPTLITPTISRAWLSRPRSVENETAEAVASDFVPIEPSSNAEPMRKSATAPSAAAQSIDSTEALPVAAAAAPVAAKSEPDRLRLISLSALVVLVVIILFFVLSNLL